MRVAKPTPDDVVRGLRRTLLMPGRCGEGNPSPDYENALHSDDAEAPPKWKSVGGGMHVLDCGDRSLVRVEFHHNIERRGTREWERLEAKLRHLAAGVRRGVPLSARATIRIGPCAACRMYGGVWVRCTAEGIVTYTVPRDIMAFLAARGMEVVAGEEGGFADERLAAPRDCDWYMTYAYRVWRVEARSLTDPEKTCRLVIDKPWSVPADGSRPMLVTGLDVDEAG
jgi:hypothetical protein